MASSTDANNRQPANLEGTLRAEARGLSWASLDASQQQAFARVVQLLSYALKSLDNAKDRPAQRLTEAFVVDPARSSRLAVLSGGRGSGKTTVMLSLARALSQAESSLWDSEIGQGTKAEQARYLEYALGGPISELRKQLVWLEPLDLEPLPRAANLLISMLVRIANVGQLKKRPQDAYRDEDSDAVMAFDDLAAQLSLAWDGNLRERQGQLDPDVYAREVLRAQRASLSVNANVAEQLENLGKPWPHPGGPLYVLSVDDFDLSPARALELLQLLRLVSVPRLFVLLLGNSNVAERVLRLRMAGELADLVKGATSQFADEINGLATPIAASALRKLLPPGQRIDLEPMTIEDALNYRPPAAGLGAKTLREVLERVRFVPDTRPEQMRIADLKIENLYKFLLPEWPERTVYSSAAILANFPRQVADLYSLLVQVVATQDFIPASTAPKGVSRDLQKLAAQEALRAIREDNQMIPRDRPHWERILAPDSKGEWTLRTEELVGTRQRARLLTTTIHAELEPLDEQAVVNLKTFRSFRLALRRTAREREKSDTPKGELSSQALQWLMLFHDLEFLSPRPSIAGSDLTPGIMDLDLVEINWHMDRSHSVACPWLVPSWRTFWEFEYFGNCWNQAVPSLVSGDKSELLPRLAFLWTSNITAILAGRQPSPPISSSVEPSKQDWTKLAAELRKIALRILPRNDPDNIERDWLVLLPALLAPERAWPLNIVRIVWDALKDIFLKIREEELAQVRRVRGFSLGQIYQSNRQLARRLGWQIKGSPGFGEESPAEGATEQHDVNTFRNGVFRPSEQDLPPRPSEERGPGNLRRVPSSSRED